MTVVFVSAAGAEALAETAPKVPAARAAAAVAPMRIFFMGTPWDGGLGPGVGAGGLGPVGWDRGLGPVGWDRGD
ncbi:hypothetical protein GCM10014713_68560 [Streptomyces purpureus]|uniref:Uncharacterized protein n=1 Tax=Streptomyces purpureus TaxID=1951 RepID=A0A918LXY3_9ACTN|nr:hypothetical protein GCM10014713_68560 [Streptomyces purpureus]